MGQDGNNYGACACYNAAGVAQGTEFQVNTYTTSQQKNSSVAVMPSVTSVVTWNSNYQDGSGDGVFARRHDSAGVPLGSEFQINTYTTSTQKLSTVAMDAAGDFVIAWSSFSAIRQRLWSLCTAVPGIGRFRLTST